MHRRKLLTLLSQYRDRYPQEQDTAARFENFVEAHEDCFERSCIPGHITGSAWVVDPAGQDLLLTHHRKLDMWLQLGGHSDGDAQTSRVALREAAEESGLPVRLVDELILDLDIHPIPARGDTPEHLHYDVRFVIQAEHRSFQVSDESHALAWVPIDEIERYTDEASILRMRGKWRSSNL